MKSKDKDIEIKWTPFALFCLNEIHNYIKLKEKDVGKADRLIESIFSKVDQLKDFPNSGQVEQLLKEIGQDSRYLIKFRFKIIYEFNSDTSTIIITDIFHTSQDPGKLGRSSKSEKIE
jgi:plasmid stabilization system protein ParE